jgi:phage tail-like protein
MSATPHYLLNGLVGWQAADLENTVLADDGKELELQPLPGSERPLVDDAGSLGCFVAAIGVAVDSQDQVYVLDQKTCLIKRFDRCLRQFVTLPCIGGCGSEPRRLKTPNGLAISCCDNLYLADTGNYRVQVFAINGFLLRAIWGPLQVNKSTTGVTVQRAIPKLTAGAGSDCPPVLVYPPTIWQPWDIAVSPRNWTFVTDYANGLIHVFDPGGRWRTAYDGAGPTTPALVKPTRIALDLEDRIYVLQEGIDYVVVLDSAGKFVGTVSASDEVRGRFCPVAVAVDRNGNLCLSDCITRQTYFYQPNGDGGWCGLRCCGSVATLAASLVFDQSGTPIFADGSQRVCEMAPDGQYPLQGRYYSGPLNSHIYRCVWHRVVLRGSVPPGTSVQVDSFTSEASKPIDEVLGLPDSRWSTGQRDTDTSAREWDCLLQAPAGRYLWLRVTLASDGAATPTLDSIKVYFPRASSLQYLPAVYQESAAAGDFLDRFLSIFDTVRGCISDQITYLARYFDPKATPAKPCVPGETDFLTWLASWLGLSLRSGWPVHKRRELVRQAHKLYKLRGTPEGMRLAIELYAGVRPQILELFKLRRWLFVNGSRLGDGNVFGDAVTKRLKVGSNSQIGSFQLIDFGDPQLDLFNAYAYQFVVVVPRWPGATDGDEKALQQVIDLAKPAETLGKLQWAEPRFRLGIQAFVGVDTVIGRYPLGVIEGHGKLGYDTVLGDPAEEATRHSMKIGDTSRVGCNTVLK